MLTPFQNRAMRALGSNHFFECLKQDCTRWIYRSSVRKGETLFEKGEPSEHLHGLVAGQLKLFSPGEEGRQLALELVAPGEVLGAVSLAGNAPQHTSAVAVTNCELATIQRCDLEYLMECYPAIRVALSREAAESATRMTRRLEDTAFLSTERRVEKALLDLVERFGQPVEAGTKIQLRQQDLADLLGLSRESVSRVLTSKPMSHRLQIGRGSIVLLGGTA